MLVNALCLTTIRMKKIFIQFCLFFLANSLLAQTAKQTTRFSLDVHAGLPYMFTNVGHGSSFSFGGGLRFSLTKYLSVQGQLTTYNIAGENDSPNNSIVGSYVSNDGNVKSYNIASNLYTVSGVFNFTSFFRPELETRLNLYGLLGAGYMYHDIKYMYVDNIKVDLAYNKPFFVYKFGFQAKYYLNYAFDLNAGVTYDLVDSYWLDGAPNDKSRNSIVSGIAGISYKLFATKKRDLIDWNIRHKEIVVPVEKIPVIKKPVVKPNLPVVEQPKIDTTRLSVVVPKLKEEVTKIEVIDTPKVVKPAIVPPVVKKDSNINLPITRYEFNEPDSVYNVVTACYTIRNKYLAIKLRTKLISLGYDAKIFRSKGSRYYRVMAISTGNKKLALEVLERCRNEIDPMAWIHVYNKH